MYQTLRNQYGLGTIEVALVILLLSAVITSGLIMERPREYSSESLTEVAVPVLRALEVAGADKVSCDEFGETKVYFGDSEYKVPTHDGQRRIYHCQIRGTIIVDRKEGASIVGSAQLYSVEDLRKGFRYFERSYRETEFIGIARQVALIAAQRPEIDKERAVKAARDDEYRVREEARRAAVEKSWM